MTALLEVEDLRVGLRSPRGVVRAVDGVSFEVEAGHLHGIVGESGSGKSTLLRAILGQLPPNAAVDGRVRVRGREVFEAARRRSAATPGVSVVFQEPMTALNPVMRVGHQIAEAPAAVLGLGRRAARQRTLDLMRQVGIPDPERRFEAYPHELSGGLRQRVLIAMALSSEPEVVLCDEPTTALDVTIQDQILRLFRRIADDTGVAMVFVTHDLAVVAQICESVSVMYAGQFMETAPLPGCFERPRHPYTHGLLAAVPDVSRGREPLNAIPGAPPDLVGGTDGCPFAPRCPYVHDRCLQGRLELAAVDERHATACVRVHEIDLARPAPERRP